MMLSHVESKLENAQSEEQHGFRAGYRIEKHLITANVVVDSLLAMNTLVRVSNHQLETNSYVENHVQNFHHSTPPPFERYLEWQTVVWSIWISARAALETCVDCSWKCARKVIGMGFELVDGQFEFAKTIWQNWTWLIVWNSAFHWRCWFIHQVLCKIASKNQTDESEVLEGGEPFSIQRGVKQGGIWSLVLFNAGKYGM